MNDQSRPEQQGKPRQGYLDPRGSESTREMRDTARRRRDAEEKLQQHEASIAAMAEKLRSASRETAAESQQAASASWE